MYSPQTRDEDSGSGVAFEITGAVYLLLTGFEFKKEAVGMIAANPGKTAFK